MMASIKLLIFFKTHSQAKVAPDSRRASFYPLGEVQPLHLFGMRVVRRASNAGLADYAAQRQTSKGIA
jgi:hypothetical protein